MADEAKKDAAPASGGSPLDNKIVLLAVIIVTQALMAVAVTQFVIAPKLRGLTAVSAAGAAANAGQKEDEKKDEPGVLVDLNKIVVSLRDKGPTTSYLSLDINLEVDNDKTAALVEQRLPHLRDIVILALSNKYADDLMSYDGKEALKAELMRKIGEVLPEGSLKNLYFSDMVVQ